MKITFFSNFLNHHQLPFCKEMINILGNNFKFVATEKIPEERIKMCYEDMNQEYDFITRAYENEKEAFNLGNESDVVIIGSAPKKYIMQRLKKNKGITFEYSERIFRKKNYKMLLKKVYYKFIKERIQKDNYYLLCASAYTADDYNSIGLFKNKTYKWGYFPEVKEYQEISKVIETKEKNSILWVARFIDVKHPETVIELANRLMNDGYNFSIKMIGIGYLEEEIKKKIKQNKLNNNVELLGAMSQEKVREYMEQSKIFLFTSDKGEGWGAVLNESMNSGCAVVASHEIGSVPFLIKDNKNGIIYKNGNIEDLYNKVKLLLENDELTKKLGLEAYRSITQLWNPKEAAQRIINLSKSLLAKEEIDQYPDGPCSKAIRIKDNWYMR